MFEQDVTASNSTTSSIASLLTGTYVLRHEVRGFHYLLDRRFLTLGEGFRHLGYFTFGFSSSFPAHLAYHDFDQGLMVTHDESILRPCPGLPPVESLKRLAVIGLIESFGWKVLPQNKVSGTREADLTAAAVLKLLRTRLQSPFFGFIHFIDPHFPYTPPARYSGYAGSIADIQKGNLDRYFRRAHKGKPPWLTTPIDVRDPRFPVAAYRGEIFFVDQELGRVLSELRRQAALKKTVVVFTADHGENLLDHPDGSLFDHRRVWDNTLRVPLVVSGPGVPKGRLVASMVRSVDILPSLFAMCNIPKPSGIDGVSFIKRFRETAPQNTTMALSESPLDDRVALRWGEFKLIRHPDGSRLLYRLSTDPGEVNDLSARFPDLTAKLSERLDALLEDGGHRGTWRTMTPEQRKQLRLLGYVDE